MGSQEKINRIGEVTYVFSADTAQKVDQKEDRTKMCQILTAIFASTCCIPYGLMLGWPSPTYPNLIKADSPVPITYDQSAMVAGFLMIGNVLGTPISSTTCMKPRYGMLIGILLMTAGWLLMWQAKEILFLLASRLLVGLGHGYASGQLKLYLATTCDPHLQPPLLKLPPLQAFAAVVAAFATGPFLDLRQASTLALLACAAVLLVCLLLPPGGRAKRSDGGAFWGVVQQPKFGVFAFLVFCQQGTGAPATMVYTQILFERSGCPHAVYLAVVYAGLFLVGNVFGAFLSPRCEKRAVLLWSSCAVVVLLVAQVCVVFLRLNETFWGYTSAVVMYSYIIVHTVGLGSVPVTFIPDFFAKEDRKGVTHFFIMFHSILALVITKIFQVLMTKFHVGIGFSFFLSVGAVAVVFVYFVVPKKAEAVNRAVFIKNLQ